MVQTKVKRPTAGSKPLESMIDSSKPDEGAAVSSEPMVSQADPEQAQTPPSVSASVHLGQRVWPD